MYNCKICSKVFTLQQSCIRHSKTHSDNKNSCKICLNTFTRRSHLSNHLITVHKLVKYGPDYNSALLINDRVLEHPKPMTTTTISTDRKTAFRPFSIESLIGGGGGGDNGRGERKDVVSERTGVRSPRPETVPSRAALDVLQVDQHHRRQSTLFTNILDTTIIQQQQMPVTLEPQQPLNFDYIKMFQLQSATTATVGEIFSPRSIWPVSSGDVAAAYPRSPPPQPQLLGCANGVDSDSVGKSVSGLSLWHAENGDDVDDEDESAIHSHPLLELLIELIRSQECLYVLSHKKYSDHMYKESCWKNISSSIGVPVNDCKKTWNNLRDAFRRAMQKSQTTSGQSAKFIKKWKYEEEMSFLWPHMRERDTISSVNIPSDVENETNNDDSGILGGEEGDNDVDMNLSITDLKDNQNLITNTEYPDSSEYKISRKKLFLGQNELNKTNMYKRKQNQRQNQPTESASVAIMDYIKTKDKNNETQTDRDGLDHFFLSIAATVRNFTPSNQHFAKSKIFSIISDMELKEL